MSLHSSNYLRTSDFTAAVWFKPAHLGGLEKQSNYRWIAANVSVRIGDKTYNNARCSPIDEWIRPGEGGNCAISNNDWRDDFRSSVEIGTCVELLLDMDEKTQGPPRCIGLGRITEKYDPHGRRFIADAEAEISLRDNESKADLPGKLVQVEFFDPQRKWIAHFDTVKNGGDLNPENQLENLFFLSLNRQVEGPYQNETDRSDGEHFKIWSESKELGSGVIKRVEDHLRRIRNVCYPEGWIEHGGLNAHGWSKR